MIRGRTFRIPFFRIFYSSTYTALLLVIFVLLAVTPGDQIYQTLSNSRLGNVFVVGGVYFVTAAIALFIYASRLYTNRIALAAIPKSYLPIQRKEVPARVRRVIVKNRQRSALIAWDSRPRDVRNEPGAAATSRAIDPEKHSYAAVRGATKEGSTPVNAAATAMTRKTRLPTVIIPIDSDAPPWGTITHPGWSGAVSRYELPEGVRFETVVAELPHLIEAAAVALAPPDSAFHFLDQAFSPSQAAIPPSSPDPAASSSDDVPSGSSTAKAPYSTTTSAHVPSSPLASAQLTAPVTAPRDPRAVALLQRPAATGLRTYLSHLVQLGILGGGPVLVEDFLARYEYARFSAHALTEGEFAALMAVFSELLGGLVPLDAKVARMLYKEMDDSDSDGEREAESGAKRLALLRTRSERSEASTQSVIRHFATGTGKS